MTIEDLYTERLIELSDTIQDALKRASDGVEHVSLHRTPNDYVWKQLQHALSYLEMQREIYNEYHQINSLLENQFKQIASNVSLSEAIQQAYERDARTAKRIEAADPGEN